MLRIVVVEDEALVRRGIVEAVDWTAMDCAVVGEAADGAEGLACVRALSPDLVICDIRMPKLGGIEMVQQLRQEGNTADVVFLTAYSDFSYAREAVRLQAADYLLKPFHDDDLEQVVQKIRKRRQAASPKDAVLPELQGVELGAYSRSAVRYIAAHYNDPKICVSQIASALEISDGHLSHIFKKETGQTLMGYLTAYRIYMAKKLLSDHRNRVYEVAEKVGYQDLSYFSATFKKITGLNPSEYQKQAGTKAP